MLKVKILTGAIALVIAGTAHAQMSRDSTMTQINVSTYDTPSKYADGGNYVPSIADRGVDNGMKVYMEDLERLEEETIANLASTKQGLDSKVQANTSAANSMDNKINANAATAYNDSKELTKQLISTKYALKGVVPDFKMASDVMYNGSNNQALKVKLDPSQIKSEHLHVSARGASKEALQVVTDRLDANDYAERLVGTNIGRFDRLSNNVFLRTWRGGRQGSRTSEAYCYKGQRCAVYGKVTYARAF